MQSRVIECDPPLRLVFTWDDDSDVTIDLEPRGNEVLLTVVHPHLGSRNPVLMHSAGWHAHLDLLVDRTRRQLPDPFWRSEALRGGTDVSGLVNAGVRLIVQQHKEHQENTT